MSCRRVSLTSFVPRSPYIADEIIDAVRRVPAYSRPLEGEFGAGVRAGVEQALHHFLAEIEAGGPVQRADVYRALGQGEMRGGRSLDALLSAYRAGARVAWRRFVTLGSAAELEPETLYLLAESIFAYIDALSAESAEGHASEQSAAASEAELHRRRLVRMLVREPAAEPSAIQAAAVAAGWELPRALAVLAASGRRGPFSLPLPQDAIAETIGDLSVAIVPDPGSRVRMLETLRSWLAEQGRIGPMSERLGVHPQTARYRLGRLRGAVRPRPRRSRRAILA